MSKRSYRRLAVFAGAAFAIGSMAPAMAAREVEANASGSASVDPNLNLDDLTGSALPLDLDGLLTTATDLTTLAQGRVEAITGAVESDVTGLLDTAVNLPGLLLGGSSTPLATVGANGSILGAVNVLGSAGVSAPLGAVGVLTGAPTALLGTVMNLETLAEVQNTVGLATEIATGAVDGASVTDLPDTVIGLVPGGLLDGGLEGILGLAGGGSVNVVASLLGTF